MCRGLTSSLGSLGARPGVSRSNRNVAPFSSRAARNPHFAKRRGLRGENFATRLAHRGFRAARLEAGAISALLRGTPEHAPALPRELGGPRDILTRLVIQILDQQGLELLCRRSPAASVILIGTICGILVRELSLWPFFEPPFT